MKVTSRELSLLIALGAVFLIYLLYTFLFNPLLTDIAVAKDALETARNQKITIENNAQTIENIIGQQEQIAAEADEKVAQYLPDLNEDLLASFFHRTASNGGPVPKSITFNELAAVNLDSLITGPETEIDYPYGNYAATVWQEEADSYKHPEPGNQDPSKSVLVRRVSLNYGPATYEQAIQQLKLVENLKRTTIVETLALSREEGGLTGMVTYAFFGVDKVTKEDSGLPKTNLTEANGKTNPF